MALGASPVMVPGPIEPGDFLQGLSGTEWETKRPELPLGLHGKGGKQNIDNEFVNEARRQADPCGWLDQRYASEKSPANKLKLQAAQKALGCRNKQKRQGA